MIKKYSWVLIFGTIALLNFVHIFSQEVEEPVFENYGVNEVEAVSPLNLVQVKTLHLVEYCPFPEDTLTSIALKTKNTPAELCALNDGIALDCGQCALTANNFDCEALVLHEFQCLRFNPPNHYQFRW